MSEVPHLLTLGSEPLAVALRCWQNDFAAYEKYPTGSMIAALSTAIGSTTTLGQQGAGAAVDSGGAAHTRNEPSKAPHPGLLGLLGLLGLKRRNDRLADDRR